MKKMLAAFLIFALLSLGALYLVKAQRKKMSVSQLPAETKPAYGDAVINGSIGEPSILNPVLASDSASFDIIDLVFNGLVKYDQDIKLVGDLAEKWDVSQDGLTITFYLRKDVKWHDGFPFTAKDVVFTYNKLIDPDSRTPFASNFQLISKLETPDSYTVIVTYKEPFAPALESWGMGILPQHVFGEMTAAEFNKSDFNRFPIGTGPYKFKEWRTGQKIELESNSDYFEGRPYIDKYIYQIIPDQSVQLLALKTHTIDMMSLTADMYVKEANHPEFEQGINRFRYPSFSYTYLAYNLNNPLFKNTRLTRQALSYAINRQEIIDGTLQSMGTICTGPFPNRSWAYNPDVKPYDYDPEKARIMLASIGWKDTNGDGYLEKGGQKFEFTILTNQGNKERELAATIIQEQLKKIGVKVNVRILEWSALIHQYVDKKSFDAILLGWNMTPDPDCFDIWFSEKTREGEYNFISYKNPQVDILLTLGRKTFDQAERLKIYHKVHALIAEDQPYAFLYVRDSLVAVDKRFQGIKVEPIGIGYNFTKWYVPKTLQKYTMQQ
ncbi:MAG: peptide-binding protein [Elusimicrobia bacterium]|nr:peptide-binding protein [Elusimicrobiota bacterium]